MTEPPQVPPPPPPPAAEPRPTDDLDVGFRLLLLDCPSCGAPLAAEGEDVVYYCTACRTGYRLGQKAVGREALSPVEVSFVALPDRVAERYLPFWLLPATVTVHERRASGGALKGLLGFFLGDGGADQGPGKGIFAVPAFAAPLGAAVALARRYTEAFPELGERLGERLTGGLYGVEDAQKLARFTLIAAEAEKPDTLQDLRYEITFGAARLLGVPFSRRGESWVDALYGLPG